MKRLHKDYMRSNEGYASWHKDPRHQWVHWFLLLIVVFGSIFAFTQVFKDYEVAGTADSNVSALYKAYITNSQVKNIKKDTSTLLSLRGERVAADTSGRASIEQDMKKVAERRKNVMLTLIRNGQADRVIDTAISDADRNNLPAEVQAFVEKRETKTGTYVWTHADYFDSGTAENEYKVVTPERSYTVHYTNANRIPSVTTGDDVSVDGLVFGDEAVVVNTDANTQAVVADTTVADGATTPTTTKRLAIMLVNFQDNTTQPFTQAQVESVYFTANDSIKKYFEEGSFGQWTLEGDVFGYYTLPMNQVTAGGCTGSTYMYSLSSAADAAATAAGVNLNTYTNKVYIFPKQTNCGWTGLGQMGAPKSWINVISTAQMSGTGAHELGHNFNLHHASSYNCTNSVGTRVTLYGGICTSTGTNEYGDPYDIMGKSSHRMHFNGFHKGVTANNGPQWLSSTNIVTLNPGSAGGTYTIKPLGQATTQTQVIRVPVPNYGYYYFEFRQTSGVFENYTGALIPGAAGVLVHVAGDFTSTSQSKLLDMTPTTTSFYDAALLPGQSYSDPNVPMTVTVNSVSPNGANITFVFSGNTSACTHFNPGVSVGAAQDTATPSTKSYNVTITNFDSSTCTASAFNYTATLPSGWTKSPESFTDIIAPGQSITKTFLVTYPTTVTPGYNNLTFIGTNATTGLTNFVGSQTVQQLVEVAGTPPQITLTSPSQGATVTGDLILSAGLSDAPGSTTQTKLFLDNVLKQTCTGWTCSITIPAAQITAGSHIAKATSTNTATGLSTQDIADFIKPGTGTGTTNAPVITLTSPVEGDSVSGDVVLSSTLATGSSATNVDSKLYIDNILKQTCNGVMTCSVTIPAAQVAAGAHTASATALYTPNGSTTSDSNAFTKTTATPPVSAPTISIPIPANNATYTNELVITTALNTTTPAGVQTKIYVDGVLKKTCDDTVSCLVTLLSSETTLGIHTISATATYLPNGSSTNASKTVTKVEVTPPPVTAPQVNLTSPNEGSSQSGDVVISANFPAGATVTNVETKLYLDGVLKNTCNGVATCVITVPAATVAAGTHTASATATHIPTGTTTNDSNTFTKTPTSSGGGPQINAVTPVEGSTQNGVIQLSSILPVGTTPTNLETKFYIDGNLRKTCTDTLICYTSIIPYTVSVGTHTFTATVTNLVTGQTSTDSHSFVKTSATPPPTPPTTGPTVGSNPNMITITAPTDGGVVTGDLTVTATTTPEALMLGRSIVIKMSTTNPNVSYQIANCSVSPCTATVPATNQYLTPGQHVISAHLFRTNPYWISAIANVTITKQ